MSTGVLLQQAHGSRPVCGHTSQRLRGGIEPDKWETYSNGVRKAIYRNADGNKIGFGTPA